MTDEKLSQQQIDFMRLLRRSPDIGDGWRQSGAMLWPLVQKFANPELTELDTEKMRVRLTEKGETLLRFAI